MRRPLPDTIADEYRSGLGIARIARKHGWGQTSVRKRLLELGVEMRPRPDVLPPPKRIDLPPSVVDEYRAGETCQQIAERHGCSKNKVMYFLHDHGVEMRPKPERPPVHYGGSSPQRPRQRGAPRALRGVRRPAVDQGVDGRWWNKHGRELPVADIIADYRGGVGTPQLGFLYRTTAARIRDILRANGEEPQIAHPDRKHILERLNELRELVARVEAAGGTVEARRSE